MVWEAGSLLGKEGARHHPCCGTHPASRRDEAGVRAWMAHTAQKERVHARRLQAATTATTLPAGAVRGDRGHVLDAPDLEPGARECAERRLVWGVGVTGVPYLKENAFP